jgi:hypothetical protein
MSSSDLNGRLAVMLKAFVRRRTAVVARKVSPSSVGKMTFGSSSGSQGIEVVTTTVRLIASV